MTIGFPSLRVLRAFGRDSTGASAVEFAIVALPFLYLILGILQMAIYYMTQSSLDAGVTTTAQSLRITFANASTTYPSASTLKADVATNSGGLVRNSSTLSVEIRPLQSLDSSRVYIQDGTVTCGSSSATTPPPTIPLVLRAQSTVIPFAPGLGSFGYYKVNSSAILRGPQGTC